MSNHHFMFCLKSVDRSDVSMPYIMMPLQEHIFFRLEQYRTSTVPCLSAGITLSTFVSGSLVLKSHAVMRSIVMARFDVILVAEFSSTLLPAVELHAIKYTKRPAMRLPAMMLSLLEFV